MVEEIIIATKDVCTHRDHGNSKKSILLQAEGTENTTSSMITALFIQG